MVLVIIAAVCCLAAATLMYTPRMRSFPYYRPLAFFFLFEGIWLPADYAVAQIAPGAVFMSFIHYIAIILLVAYLVVCVFLNTRKKKGTKKK